MIFDEAARKLHESQDSCYACGEKFVEKDPEKGKVRDHCHFSGKYRGSRHAKCNLRLKKSKTVPVFFHNLTGYDSHIFVKRLADSIGGVRCIPRNEEKYITFSKEVLVEVVEEVEVEEMVEEEGEDGRYEERKVTKEEVGKIFCRLKFVNTLNFMRSSLEKLAGNLERDQLKHLGKYFQGERMKLMCGKGTESEAPRAKLTSQGRVSVAAQRGHGNHRRHHLTLPNLGGGLPARAEGFQNFWL